MSSTLLNWLLENITIKKNINDHLVKVWVYVNAVNRVSNGNIGIQVERLSWNDFEDNIFTLISKFLSNINKEKKCALFSQVRRKGGKHMKASLKIKMKYVWCTLISKEK